MTDIICAGNALKEVMSGGDCLAALEAGARNGGAKVRGEFVISDGGDGFLEACGRGSNCKRIEEPCIGPLGDAIMAPFLFDEKEKRAFIEIALCSGLRLVESSRRNIMISGTAGVGDLLVAARDLKAQEIFIGLGGSATCDGGIGFLWRLADLAGQCRQGTPEPRVAMDMPELSSPDIPGLRKWLNEIRIVGCVDVKNPLLGSNGAACMFAPQKGASIDQAEQLEGWMEDWCERIERNAGEELCEVCGAGAAGGLGFALAAVGADMQPGTRTVADLIGLSKAIVEGSLLITTEGKFDMTSLGGKAPWAAAKLAREKGARAVIFCGVADDEAVRRAAEQRIDVVQFARDLAPDQRVSQSPGRLSDAVADYVKSMPSTSA